jgi:DNA-binding SARP family transcriptional activator/tetratricopeptide (TPR) repeat protein
MARCDRVSDDPKGVSGLEFRLFGSVEIWAAGQLFDAGQPRQRGVLAALLVDAGHVVTWDTLIDRVWGHTPPERARHSLYSHVARIRRILDNAALASDEKPALLRRQTGGYLMDVDPNWVDLHRFQRLVDHARAPECRPAECVVALREALALWRGEPMAGLGGDWVLGVRAAYTQRRLDAVLAWAAAELAADNPRAVVAPLIKLVAEYPLVEPLTAALMRALHASGRTSHALECYRSARRRLADELGAEPGPELRTLHRNILRGESRPVAGTRPDAVVATRDVPAQLPAAIATFAGRSAELEHLDAVLARAQRQPTALTISALVGTAGVGKTTLAVHWAHLVAHHFPDGQLYVDLRGFDPRGTAVTPDQALRGFLEAFAVPRQRIPADRDAQAALYRSLLAGRRVLILLDNAADAEHVRPLLPGSAGNLVLVTSRRQLTSLVTSSGADPLTVDLLSVDEARDLLACRLTRARVVAEPAATEEIIALCARLPLALAIVAARAATRPGVSLRALADEVRRPTGGLEVFSGDDAATNVRAVFSWSYRTLSPAAARLFRLLSLHPGPDITPPAAARLLATSHRDVRKLLTELVGAHLVTAYTSSRYAVHDLLRAYAGELAKQRDPERERHAATRRILDHYLYSAFAADRLLHPRRDPIELPPQPADDESEPFTDATGALGWFTTEHLVLLGTVKMAAATGMHRHAWQLAWALTTYLDRTGHWHDWASVARLALESAGRLADPLGQAHAHRGLAGAAVWLGRYEEAHRNLRRALDLFAALDEPAGQAHVHLDLCWVFERQGDQHSTLDHARRALVLYRRCKHQAGQARALNTIGWSYALTGDHREAHTWCRRALALHVRIGDRSGAAYTWDSLGFVHHGLAEHADAAACYRRAVDLFRDLDERFYEADTLTRLGDVHEAAGDPEAARRAWERAHEILVELNHPDVEAVRAKLAARPGGQ